MPKKKEKTLKQLARDKINLEKKVAKEQERVDKLTLKKKEKKLEQEIKSYSRGKLRKVSDLMPGEVLVFKYPNAKTKDKMHHYDQSPLVIVLSTYKKNGNYYMLGINLHWITKKNSRKKIFNLIVDKYLEMDWKVNKNFKMLMKRFIMLTYLKLKGDPALNSEVFGNNALRLYLVDRIKEPRRFPIKNYPILFSSGYQSTLRARWSYLSKQHKIQHF